MLAIKIAIDPNENCATRPPFPIGIPRNGHVWSFTLRPYVSAPNGEPLGQIGPSKLRYLVCDVTDTKFQFPIVVRLRTHLNRWLICKAS